MVTGIVSRSMRRTVSVIMVFLAVCSCWSANRADSLARLKQMLVLLDNLQENSKYTASIPYGMELIRKAELLRGPESDEIIVQTRMYLMEAYRELQLFPQFEAAAKEFQVALEQDNKKKAATKMEIVGSFGRTLLYADYCASKKEYPKANALLHQAIRFIMEHQEFYLPGYSPGRDCKPHRLFQCYDRLGQITLKEQNYAQAQVYFVEALKHARLADLAIRNAKLEEQGCEEKILIQLIRLTLKTKDHLLFRHYLDAHKKINKSGAYEANRSRDLFNTLLQKEDLSREEGVQLISRFNTNTLASVDLETQFNVIDFYLKFRELDPAKNLLERIKPALHHNSHIASWYLARAGMAHIGSDPNQMTQFIDSSLYFLRKDKAEQDLWQDKGLRTQLFETVQKGIIFHDHANQTGQNPWARNKTLALIEEFIPGLKAIRTDFISDADRLLLVQQLTPVLDLALKTLSDTVGRQQVDFNLVLACFEAGKAFNLLSGNRLKKNLDDPTLKTYNNLLAEQQKIQFQIGLPGANLDDLQRQISSVQSQLNELLAMHTPAQPLGLTGVGDIRQQLDPNTSLVELFKGADFIYVLVIDAVSTQLTRMPLTGTDLEADLKNLQLSMLMRNEPDLVATRDSLFRQAAWNLYRSLLKPVEPGLKHRVILVPDPALAQIPFAALLTQATTSARYKHWPYWIHRHRISIQYSAALWLDQLLDKEVKRDKKFEYTLTSFAPEFKDLMYNQQECKKLQQIINPSKGYYGIQADLGNFKKQGGLGRILHIASHAQSNTEVQARSYIRLEADTVYAGEIGWMDLPLDLVFLSACETGTGKLVSGEGMMSLGRSFFEAGAKSVITTLWPIADDISMAQVIEVYRNLKSGKPKDEAIQKMQIDYLAGSHPEEAFPAFWAAFQCHGDFRPLFLHPLRKPMLILALSAIFAFGLGIMIYAAFRRREGLKPVT